MLYAVFDIIRESPLIWWPLSQKPSSASLSSRPSPLSYQSKGHGFDSQRMHVWLRSLAGMHCKSLWLKAIAKCINANVFVVTKLLSTQPVFQKWFDIVTHWEEMTETKPLVVVEVSAFIFKSLILFPIQTIPAIVKIHRDGEKILWVGFLTLQLLWAILLEPCGTFRRITQDNDTTPKTSLIQQNPHGKVPLWRCWGSREGQMGVWAQTSGCRTSVWVHFQGFWHSWIIVRHSRSLERPLRDRRGSQLSP